MHPLLTVLGSNPALMNAAQTAWRDVRPALEKAMRGRARVLSVGAGGAAALATTCFAAGVAVGWLTAPESGSHMRARTMDGIKTWAGWAKALVKHDEDSPVNGSVTDLEPSEVVAGDDGVGDASADGHAPPQVAVAH